MKDNKLYILDLRFETITTMMVNSEGFVCDDNDPTLETELYVEVREDGETVVIEDRSDLYETHLLDKELHEESSTWADSNLRIYTTKEQAERILAQYKKRAGLINFSNHPYEKWSEEQKKAALEQFGNVTDLPFPEVDPALSAEDVHQMAWGKAYVIAHENKTVLIAGEQGYVAAFVRAAEAFRIRVVHATSRRNVIEDPNDPTKKIVKFDFVQFRRF